MKLLIPFALLLAGCATTPSIPASVSTAAQLNTAALTAAVSLAQSGALSSAQLSKVIGITNAVEAALTVAETSYNAGNATGAQAQYTAALTALSGITACLKLGSAANAIDACIAGVPTP